MVLQRPQSKPDSGKRCSHIVLYSNLFICFIDYWLASYYFGKKCFWATAFPTEFQIQSRRLNVEILQTQEFYSRTQIGVWKGKECCQRKSTKEQSPTLTRGTHLSIRNKSCVQHSIMPITFISEKHHISENKKARQETEHCVSITTGKLGSKPSCCMIPWPEKQEAADDRKQNSSQFIKSRDSCRWMIKQILLFNNYAISDMT